jgi:hypothetical protein
MHARILATTHSRGSAASRKPNAQGVEGDVEPMWSLELTLVWAHLDTTCGDHHANVAVSLVKLNASTN